MPEIRQVGVWVTTDKGADIEEYALETIDDRTMACYVSSEPGQEFMLRVKCDDDSTDLMMFRVHIDGHSLTGKICESGSEKYVDGLSVSNALFRPFVFSPWSEEASEVGCSAWHQVGLIEVRVYRVRRVEHTVIQYHAGFLKTRLTREECQKVGVFHHFKLGEPATSQRPERCKIEYVDPRDEPYARFQFRYRSSEVLDSLGLLSPYVYDDPLRDEFSPSVLDQKPAINADSAARKRKSFGILDASPLPPSRRQKQEPQSECIPSSYSPVKRERRDYSMSDGEEDSELELEAMEAKLRVLQSAIQRKKAKRDSRMSVKRELSPIRVPPSQLGEPIIIDLT